MSPSKVEQLLVPFWLEGKTCSENMDSIENYKQRVKSQLLSLRNDFKRILNPTPYKVLINIEFYPNFIFFSSLSLL